MSPLVPLSGQECVGHIAAGGTDLQAYTTDCASSDVADGASCTLTCSASGYSGSSTVLCTAGSFADPVYPSCAADACTTHIAAGGTDLQAYTTDCASSDVADGASCTLTCLAAGYSGTATVLCTAGSFAETVAPTCLGV